MAPDTGIQVNAGVCVAMQPNGAVIVDAGPQKGLKYIDGVQGPHPMLLQALTFHRYWTPVTRSLLGV